MNALFTSPAIPSIIFELKAFIGPSLLSPVSHMFLPFQGDAHKMNNLQCLSRFVLISVKSWALFEGDDQFKCVHFYEFVRYIRIMSNVLLRLIHSVLVLVSH